MFFISGNKNTKLNNLKIKNVSNSGKECDCDPSRIDDYKVMSESNFGNNYNLTFKNYLGNNINPILITSSHNIEINKVNCYNIHLVMENV